MLADVASAAGWERVQRALPEPRALVINASSLEQSPAGELGLESWQRQLDVNLTQL